MSSMPLTLKFLTYLTGLIESPKDKPIDRRKLMIEKNSVVIPSFMLPLLISAVVGFGSYQVAMAEAANTKLTVTELKAKVTEVATEGVKTGKIAEVNSAKIEAVVKAIEKNSETNERTAESLDKLIILLMQKNS